MDVAQQTRHSRKQQLLRELAELMIEEQVEEGVFLDTPHYSVIELAAMDLGRELSRETQQRGAREIAAACEGQAACPTCRSQCEIRLEKREVASLSGPVEFVDQCGLEIELVSLPPDHSKSNPIERCWGVLEQHWNGTLLSCVETVLNWAASMTWRGVPPIVRRIEGLYERGARLTRSEPLPQWSLVITPTNRETISPLLP